MGYVLVKRQPRLVAPRRVVRGARSRRAAFGDDDITIPSPVFRQSAERWRGALEQAAPDIPTNFLVAWLDEESGGNECSTGILTPGKQEAGIWQTMHPQDDKYGATYEQLRQGCSGQQLVDPSAVDREAQMAGVNLVRDYMAIATARLASAGVRWDRTSSDYWKAVKSIHGVPCILSEALPAVVARYGVPSSWEDFWEKAMTLSPSQLPSCGRYLGSMSTQGRRNRLDDIFENAASAGKWGGGVLAKLPVGGTGLLVASAAILLVLLLRNRSRSTR